MPLRPYLRNLKGETISDPPPFRPVLIMAAGGSSPLYLASIGLGSKVSTCDGPPFMNRKMTRLALGRKWGVFGARGLSARGIAAVSDPARAGWGDDASSSARTP